MKFSVAMRGNAGAVKRDALRAHWLMPTGVRVLLPPYKNMETKVNKTKIEKRMKKKMDSSLVETIIKLKKTNPVVAKELAKPKRRWPAVNLKELAMVEGDVLIAGKVLSAGELDKSKRVVAWSASEKAMSKIKEAKASFVSIIEEMKKNPELNGLNIVK